MNFELYFAKKIIKGGTNSFSKPIINISIAAIALGIAMMTLSICIVEGFQSKISEKISGFGAHIQITNYQSQSALESTPLLKDRPFISNLQENEEITTVQFFAHKGAILKTENENYGVVLKGIDSSFSWDFFQSNLVEGRILNLNGNSTSNEILISKTIADKMQIQLGDEILLYFVQQPPRYRKLKTTGIYHTGLGEMDERMVLADIGHIQKINGWKNDQVGGIEIILKDFDKLDQMEEWVYQEIDHDLTAISIKNSRLDIFNWLELQDVNVVIIISLLILVCGIDIISALLILILERTNMIGLMKAVGAKNTSIRKIFIYNAMYLIVVGTFIGNVFGLGIAALQQEIGFLSLPQEAYFIDQVPIEFNLSKLITLNLSTVFICTLMMIIPSNLISKLDPTKAIRFQ